MGHTDHRDRRIAVLEARLSRLAQATLRITGDLNFDSVLQGVLDSARSLAEARYGVIALHDGEGKPQDFLSSGMTPEEADRLCDRLGVMDNGRVIKMGSPHELKSEIGDPAEVSLESVFLELTGRNLRD